MRIPGAKEQRRKREKRKNAPEISIQNYSLKTSWIRIKLEPYTHSYEIQLIQKEVCEKIE